MVGDGAQRFFGEWPFVDAHELAPEELPDFKRDGYWSVWFLEGRIDRAEFIAGGEMRWVGYFGRTYLEPSLLVRHRSMYGKLPFRLILDETLVSGLVLRETYRYDESGTLDEIVQRWSSPGDGRELRTVWLMPDRRLNRSWEEEYDADGRRIRTVERNFDGTVVGVFDADE